MNREEFIQRYFAFCEELNLSPEDVLVSAGGALLMLGLREQTEDLDLDVDLDIYEQHVTSENVAHSSLGEYINYNEYIALHPMMCPIERMEIDGVYIYSIPMLIQQKCDMLDMQDRIPEKRERDLRDLESLKALSR